MYKAALPYGGGWKKQVAAWIEEDVPSFDVGGLVVGSKVSEATVWCKSPGVLAGVPFANEVFLQCGLEVNWLVDEGKMLDAPPKQAVARVKGPVCQLLLAERTALNLLSRSSGIASRSRLIVDAARKSGYKGMIAGTRKTTPGLRIVEKYAMAVGGVDMHRYDLSSMVMLKDNHVWSTGSITNAVKNARDFVGFSVKIEVECQSEQEAEEAIIAGADVVMLDNLTPEGLHAAAASLKKRHGSGVLVECSGGLTLENISAFLSNDVDIYSTSSVHQGVPVVDFSMKIDH